ncbi:Double-stranded RNA-dependent protein kinase [Scomber scombrus]|uniref:Double-stranded RNA-dependent protein kinase n=1 Tax=Scomber scombrus TaxID=13677 RepID=A0AAV1MYB5_SCOSC
MENRPPPVPAQGFESNSDKMLDVQQPPFLICGADLDEKVAVIRYSGLIVEQTTRGSLHRSTVSPLKDDVTAPM